MTSTFGIGEIMESIADLIYDESILEEIKTVLQAGADDLQGGKHLPDPSASHYGGSPAAVELSYNAAKAREMVIEAITNLAVGLQGYRSVVDDFHRRTGDVTTDSAAGSQQIAAAMECVGDGHIASANQCEMPGTGGGN